ncbi:endonuclease I family protein [Promicromonospora sp. NPDC090134]|uniref:endonuclease I family protein n=1 Tax=Promicromonospora sp. NPDC090134 TaxID=3364408 RepID=UPI00380A8363
MRTRLGRARGLGRAWGSGLSALAVAAGVLAAPGAVAQDAATSATTTSTAGAQAVADIPAGYYAGAEGLTGEALKSELNDIISDADAVSYSQVWDGLMATDEDPANPNNVILLYTGESRAKSLNGGDVGDWNREHVWAKSHGDFGTSTGPGTDLHHLRPADVQVNSIRGNKDFDDGGSAVSGAPGNYTDSDSFEPRDEVKGDVARMILYMAVRWEGEDSFADLEPNDTVNNGSAPYHGKVSTLLEWNDADPVSAFEAHRNDVIYEQFQHNRNPFVDHPEWADTIWG